MSSGIEPETPPAASLRFLWYPWRQDSRVKKVRQLRTHEGEEWGQQEQGRSGSGRSLTSGKRGEESGATPTLLGDCDGEVEGRWARTACVWGRAEVSVLLHTCDAYSRFWRGWSHYFSLNVNASLCWPLLFANEEETAAVEAAVPLVRCGVMTHSPTGSGEFSSRLRTALAAADTPFVLYMQVTSHVHVCYFTGGVSQQEPVNWRLLCM